MLGTLRLRGFLDHALGPLLDRPVSHVDPVSLDILRLGAHQLLNLRVPDRAAVSESVELAKAEAPRAAGFVNAVLRKLARTGPPAEPDPAKDPKRLAHHRGLAAGMAGRALALPPRARGRGGPGAGPALAEPDRLSPEPASRRGPEALRGRGRYRSCRCPCPAPS